MVVGFYGAILHDGTSLPAACIPPAHANQSSRLVPPADDHNTTGEVIPSAHGDGPVQVSLAGFPLEIDNYVMNASMELDGRFAFNEDFNDGCTVGISEYASSRTANSSDF